MQGAGRRAGMALLLTVWILTLLAVIVGEFMASGRVKAAAEHNKRDDLRALALALAGYRAAVAALDADVAGVSLDQSGRLLLHVQGIEDPVVAAAQDVPLGDGSYSWSISDEDGLLKINEAQRSQVANLLQQCGMQPGAERDTVVDSILDWRDANSDHRLNGAEEDYYRGLDPPYSCKDGPFDVAEELLLVRGVTPRLYAGGGADGKALPGLRELVSTRTGKINQGTAPQAVLDALGLARPSQPTAPSRHYAIIAAGKPRGNAPPRALRAVVLRADEGGSRSFSLVYWNDSYNPE